MNYSLYQFPFLSLQLSLSTASSRDTCGSKLFSYRVVRTVPRLLTLTIFTAVPNSIKILKSI